MAFSAAADTRVMNDDIRLTWRKVLSKTAERGKNGGNAIYNQNGTKIGDFSNITSTIATMNQVIISSHEDLVTLFKARNPEHTLCYKGADLQKPWLWLPNDSNAFGGRGFNKILNTFIRADFKNGYCYLGALVDLSFDIAPNHTESFCDTLTTIPEILGPFPSFDNFAKLFFYLVRRYPEILESNLPAIGFSAKDYMFHVADRRGLPTGWCVLRVGTVSDLLTLFLSSGDDEVFTYPIGSSGLEMMAIEQEMPEVFYNRCSAKLMKLLKTWRTNSIVNALSTDMELVAFLVLSPAHMLRLEDLLKRDTSLRLATLASTEQSLETLAVLRCGLNGFRMHFAETELEKGWCSMMEALTQTLQESSTSAAQVLERHVRRVGSRLISAKNRIESCERQLLMQRVGAFRTNFNLNASFYDRFYDTMDIASCGALSVKSVPFGWFKPTTRKKSFLPLAIKRTIYDIYLNMIQIVLSFYIPAQYVMLVISTIGYFFSLQNFATMSVKYLLRSHLGRFWARYAFSALIAIIAYCLVHIQRHKPQLRLQATNEKRFISILAFCILAIYTFDAGLADILSSSLSKISRLANMLVDDHRGFGTKMASMTLQSGIEENELSGVSNVLSVALEVLDEEEPEIDDVIDTDTFGSWVALHNESDQNIIRKLQYDCREKYALNVDNVDDLARRMTETKCAWGQVVGYTGSGKSTRLPVSYRNILRETIGRKQRILVCEPTKASTVNVCAGISHNHGAQVYGKHEGWEKPGDMSIQVMTYGTAVFRQLSDANFINQFDAVFLDESHLVSNHSLVFESMCDEARKVRKFYVSATPRDGAKCPEARRRFPITTHTTTCTDVHVWLKAQGSGDALDVLKHSTILVFLAGTQECDKMAAKWNSCNTGEHRAYALHGQNFASQYNKVVDAMDEGKVVVFTTNILETGVTLSVDCVVDFGYIMRPELDISNKTLALIRKRVTGNERAQRMGRAGRMREGFAILCGPCEERATMVSSETLYEAALLSFVAGVSFHVNSQLEMRWLEGITRRQAQVMCQFNLSPFLLRDIVQADGSVPTEILPLLQKHTTRICEITTTNAGIRTPTYATWPAYWRQVQAQTHGQGTTPSELQDARVPFIIGHEKTLDWEKLATICESFRPRVSKLFRAVEDGKRVITLQTSKHNIAHSLSMVHALHKRIRTVLSNKMITLNNMRSGMFLKYIPLKTQTRKLEDEIKLLERNKQKVVLVMERLQHELANNQGEFLADINTEDMVVEILELQSKHGLQQHDVQRICDVALPTSSLVAAMFMHGNTLIFALLAMLAAALLSMVFRTEPADEDEELEGHYILEGKGRKFDRSKRMDIPREEQELFDNFNEQVEKRHSRLSKHTHAEKPIRTVKQKFYHFYDITSDDDVVEALFRTLDGEVLHTTKTPLSDLALVQDKLDDYMRTCNLPTTSWAEIERMENNVICEFTNKDGYKMQVNLVPHNPYHISTALGTVGFSEKKGQLRQVNATRIIGKADKKASAQPEVTLEAQTENVILGSKKTKPVRQVRENLRLEALSVKPHSIISTEAITSCVGKFKIGENAVNCILYTDWILAPAHFQQHQGLAKFIFPHATHSTTTEELNAYGVVRFNGLDLIAIRRPALLRPVKRAFAASCMKQPTEIQMIYMDKQGRHVMTLSDVAVKSVASRWSHSISTRAGMCGCAVLDPTRNLLVGIHIAANDITNRNEFQAFNEEVLKVLTTMGGSIPREPWMFNQLSCGYSKKTTITLQSGTELATLNDTIEGFGFNLKGKHVNSATQNMIEQFQEKFTGGGFKLIGQMSSALINKHTFTAENPYLTQFLNLNPQFGWLLEYMDEYAPSVLNFEAYYKDVTKYDRKPNKNLKYDEQVGRVAQQKLVDILRGAGMTKTNMATNLDVLCDLQWKTSSGPAYQGKKLEVLEHLDDEQLLQFAEACRTNFIAGNAPGIWNGSLKAELRSIEKVQQKKTRVFTAAPITSLLAMKHYVDDFNKQFYATHLRAPHTVGINKFNRGWQRLFDKLNKPGWLHGSGDGSRFDSSIDPFLFEVVKNVRKEMSEHQFDEEIDVIYEEILNTRISLANGMVIQKCVGNNSGQPSTVVDNTLVLIFSFLYAYAKKTGDTSFESMDDRFVFVCNGDDNKFAVSPQFVQQFGGTFTTEMEQLGLNYEFDELTPDICENPYMSLTMVHTNFGVGFSLALERIVGILQWSKKDGLLHAYLSGIAAAVEAFNTPQLFHMIYTYLLWLIANYEDEIIPLMEMKKTFMPLPTVLQIYELHYVEGEFESLTLQSGNESEDIEATRPLINPNSAIAETGAASTWKLPAIKLAQTRGKLHVPLDVIKSVPKEALLFDNTVASQEKVQKWKEAVSSDLGITTDADWNSVLVCWISWCINNGTSDKLDESEIMEIKGDLNTTSQIPIRPFVVRARELGGLRQIMRYFSADAIEIISSKQMASRWGKRHGLTGSALYIAFDFLVVTDGMSASVVNQIKQARLAAIGVGETNSMITSDKTNLRKTTHERVVDYNGHEDLLN